MGPLSYLKWLHRRGNLRNFWDDIVRKFGSRDDIINIPGAPSITNKYIDYLEKKALAPHLSSSEGKTVLDVGTGIGRWALLLAEKADYIVGIDISREMVRIAKRRVNRSNVDFLVATAYAIPLRSDSVDLSLSCTCIQHIVDRDKQLESLHEITRVTRNRILLLELMSKSSWTRLTHYPTLVVPQSQYVSALKTSEVKSITDVGVDFLPLVKLVENYRNFLFKKLGVEVPSYEGSTKQRLLRNSYQIISVFALLFSLPFNKMSSNPSSNLTRHVLLVVRKG
jgi:ubiquinone/menaquinone biosynthesis C-methylase UbiE